MLPVSGQMIRVKLVELPNAKEWKSSMIGVQSKTLLITIPVGVANPHTSLVPGTLMEVQYHGRDGAKMSFQTTVVKTSYEPPQVELESPQRRVIRREQRRDFVRVAAGLPVRIEAPFKSPPEIVDVFMRDLSGGGVALLIPPELTGQVGIQVRVRFTIPKINAHIDTKCTVMRISEQNETGFRVWSLMFSDMKDSVRQKIVQYTFLRQRELQDLNRDMSRS